MRIDCNVAMAGKMLGARHDTNILQTTHVLHAVQRHFMFVFAKRPVVDYRVGGIVINIDHWCVVDLYAHSFALFANQSAVFIDKRGIVHRAHHHLSRQRQNAVHPHAQPIFGIYGNEQRRFCKSLHLVDQRCLLKRTALEKADAANAVFFYRLLHLVFVKGYIFTIG